MKYLSIEEVAAIQYEAVKRFGGSGGVRDFGLLHSAVERPKASFGGKDLYVSVHSKAAALLHSLILNHPFVDGNKRTAYISTARFFAINNIILVQDKNEIVNFVLKIEKEKLTIKEIAKWLKLHSSEIRA